MIITSFHNKQVQIVAVVENGVVEKLSLINSTGNPVSYRIGDGTDILSGTFDEDRELPLPRSLFLVNDELLLDVRMRQL